MAASMVLRLSSSCPSSKALLFRAFRARGLSLALDSAVLRGGAAEIFRRQLSFSPAEARRFSLARFCSSSSTESVEERNEGLPHQWPEWETFVEMLKAKGHFSGGAAAGEDGAGDGTGGAAVSSGAVDFNRLKNACLMFARDRFDLLRSLSIDDIRAIVEYGCPSMQRKPTNSGKRLRAFLMLNESDVCGVCSLRGSCDRVNLTLNNEQGARTVDVIRIILYYAVDPNLLLRFDASQRRRIEGSIRSLLSKLTKLSETPVDASLLDTVRVTGISQDQPQKSKSKSKIKSKTTQMGRSMNVEMKRGDWLCSKCKFLNFSRNLSCMECGSDGPKKVDFGEVEMKKGDWSCPECQFMNFARNRECRRCHEQRPARELNPGEWECPSCDFLNYRRNKICLKCRHQHPGEEEAVEADSGGHEWQRPAALR